MFETLVLQYLNKLIEGEIRDLSSPEAFHAVKVQGFNGNRIKSFTKIRSKFPMEIFALIGNLAVKSCEFTDGAPPTIRPFLFTAKGFVEITKFRQGLFQRLWVLDFLTRAKCQVSVFHTEVCPNVLTCCRQRVGICEVRRDTQPIVTAIITLYRYASDITVPLAVLEKSIWHSIIYPLARIRIPFTEVNSDTIVRERS